MLSLFWRKPPGSLAERTRRRVTLHLIPYLFFLYILAYLDRVNVSVAELAMEEPRLEASVTSAAGLLATAGGQGPVLAVSGFLAGRTEPLGVGGMGFDKSIIGFGFGIFFWGYWILEIPGTVSVVRWGARWVFVRILILWGICAALVGMIGTPFAASLFSWLPHLPEHSATIGSIDGTLNTLLGWIVHLFGNDRELNPLSSSAQYVNGLAGSPACQFYFLRFMLGFFEGGFFPSVIVYLTLWFRTEDRAKAVASFMAAIPLSSMLGVPLSGLLLGVHWFNLPGWRWIFILEGIVPILAGFATLFFLPDRPAKAKWLLAEERDWLEAELDREHQAKRGQGHRAWIHHLGIILLLTVVYFCLNLTSYGLATFLPAIVKSQAGASDLVATFLAALAYLMGFLGILLNGWHSDRTGERPWHVAVPLAMLSVGIWVAAALDEVPVLPALVMIFLVGTFWFAHLPAFWPIPTIFLGATAAASAIGFINMIGNLGGSVGPMLVGNAAMGQTSFAPALVKIAPWPLLAAAIILIVGYTRRKLTTAVPRPPGSDAPLPAC